MKLVLAEKPSVAQSLAKVLGANKRCDGFWKAMAISSAGVSAIWSNSVHQKPTMKPLPNGGWMICRSCRRNGSIRSLFPLGSSSRF